MAETEAFQHGIDIFPIGVDTRNGSYEYVGNGHKEMRFVHLRTDSDVL